MHIPPEVRPILKFLVIVTLVIALIALLGGCAGHNAHRPTVHRAVHKSNLMRVCYHHATSRCEWVDRNEFRRQMERWQRQERFNNHKH